MRTTKPIWQIFFFFFLIFRIKWCMMPILSVLFYKILSKKQGSLSKIRHGGYKNYFEGRSLAMSAIKSKGVVHKWRHASLDNVTPAPPPLSYAFYHQDLCTVIKKSLTSPPIRRDVILWTTPKRKSFTSSKSVFKHDVCFRKNSECWKFWKITLKTSMFPRTGKKIQFALFYEMFKW